MLILKILTTIGLSFATLFGIILWIKLLGRIHSPLVRGLSGIAAFGLIVFFPMLLLGLIFQAGNDSNEALRLFLFAVWITPSLILVIRKKKHFR